MARTQLEGLSRNELLTRAEELQQENAAITRDNADLRRQIDAYFNNEGYDPFDMSLVLRERALSAESQLQEVLQRYEQVSAEYEGLKEDLDSTKEAKRQSDKAYREAMATISKMEKDVQFYRKSFVDAMQARDRASGEVEKLHVENTNMAQLRSKCQAELKAERTAHAEMKRRVQICEAELAAVQQHTTEKVRTTVADSHPEVEKEYVDRANVQNGRKEARGPVAESVANSEELRLPESRAEPGSICCANLPSEHQQTDDLQRVLSVSEANFQKLSDVREDPVEARTEMCDGEDSSSSWQWNGSERIKVSDTSSPTKDRTPPSSDGREACEESVTSG